MQTPTAKLHTVALLFDFDGTLVDLAPTPESIIIPSTLRPLLDSLITATEGALALVSGRGLQSLDNALKMPEINASGSHGAVYRHRNRIFQVDDAKKPPASLGDNCQAFAEQHALIFEDKVFSLCLHFRQHPELEPVIDAWLKTLLAPHTEFVIQKGKCVREIKHRDIHKGKAVEYFMQQAEFNNKTPWFFGDDVTDEYAFEVVNRLGGHAVKIGSGETKAKHTLNNPAAVNQFMAQWLEEQA